MKFAQMALRNLSRNRRRSLISLLVVGAGTIGLLLTAGFIRFSFDGLREAIIHGGLGHLEVATAAAVDDREASSDRPLIHGLSDWEELRREVESVEHVTGAGAMVHLMGIVQAGESSASFLGTGVEPDRERRMGFTTKMISGDPLADEGPEAGSDTVLLGRGVAESLGVEAGDWVTLLAMTPDGMLNALDMEVRGIITTGVQDLDTRFLKLHIKSAQRLLETDLVSDLVIGLEETRWTAATRAELENRLAGQTPELRVVDWRQRAPFYDQVRSLYAGIFWFLGSIIFVLVVLSTSNTLMMSVMERVREFGTLLAIGTSRRQIAAIVVFEAIWLGLLGAVLGDFAGFVLIHGINSMKIMMPPPPGAVSGIDLQLAVVPEAFGGAIVLMLVVLTLASIVPTVKAVRLRIVDALGHV